MNAAVAESIEKFSRIDVLINNVAYSLLGDTESTTDEQARHLFETNFWGAANLTREAVRVMREENPKTGQIGGVIVFMSSAGARVAFPGGTYYYAT
jgi:NAD(P)-dependent dehydrogenase (short-subunit alcohol dehydrogenase family)